MPNFTAINAGVGTWATKTENFTEFCITNVPQWRISWVIFTKFSGFVGSSCLGYPFKFGWISFLRSFSFPLFTSLLPSRLLPLLFPVRSLLFTPFPSLPSPTQNLKFGIYGHPADSSATGSHCLRFLVQFASCLIIFFCLAVYLLLYRNTCCLQIQIFVPLKFSCCN